MSALVPFRGAGRRRALGSTASLILLALIAATTAVAPAAATESGTPSTRVTYDEKVRLAGGAWLTETETTSSDLTVRVFNQSIRLGDDRAHYKTPQVILFFTHRQTDPATNVVTRTEYEGFLGTDPTAFFAFSPTLDSATARFDLPLFGYQCIEDGPAGIAPPACHDLDAVTVQVDLTWTGYGAVGDLSDRTSIDERPLFGFRSRTRGQVRSATLVGTVAGDGLVLADGAADVGLLLLGTYSEDTVIGG